MSDARKRAEETLAEYDKRRDTYGPYEGATTFQAQNCVGALRALLAALPASPVIKESLKTDPSVAVCLCGCEAAAHDDGGHCRDQSHDCIRVSVAALQHVTALMKEANDYYDAARLAGNALRAAEAATDKAQRLLVDTEKARDEALEDAECLRLEMMSRETDDAAVAAGDLFVMRTALEKIAKGDCEGHYGDETCFPDAHDPCAACRARIALVEVSR